MQFRLQFALTMLGASTLAAAHASSGLRRVPARQVAGGTIVGTVTLHMRPPQRITGTYPGAALTPHAVQSLQAIAYLKGRVPGAAPARSTLEPTMMQHDTAFVPGTMAVAVGTTVSFPNDDPFYHNVFSYSRAKRFDLGRYPKGTTKTVTFNQPGIVKVYCEVHNFMRAVILVTENPYHTVVAADGRFRIPDVPPGEYTLVIWHPDLGETEQHVVVPASGSVEVRASLG